MKQAPVKLVAGVFLYALLIATANAVIIHDAHTHRATGIYYSREQLATHALELGAQFPCVGQGVVFTGDLRSSMGSVVKFDDFVVGSLHGLNNARNAHDVETPSVVFGGNAKQEFLAGNYHVPVDYVEVPELDLVLYFFEDGELDYIPSATPYHVPLEVGMEVVHAGRGNFAHLGDTEAVWDSRLRGVVTDIDSFGYTTAGPDQLVTAFRRPISSKSRPYGGRGADGDSGGGAFMRLPDGSWVCVGFNQTIFGDPIDTGLTTALRMSDPRVVALFEEHSSNQHPSPDELRQFVELIDGNLVLHFEQYIGEEAPSSIFRRVVQGYTYTPQLSDDLISWEDGGTVSVSDALKARTGYQWFKTSLAVDHERGFIRVLVR